MSYIGQESKLSILTRTTVILFLSMAHSLQSVVALTVAARVLPWISANSPNVPFVVYLEIKTVSYEHFFKG